VKVVWCKETVSLLNKQSAVIELLTAEDVLSFDIYWQMNVICGGNYVDIGTV
jgi:hypothetical protein